MVTGPQVRISLEHMRQDIVHAMGERNREIEAAVADSLSNLIKEFDFETVVSTIAREVMEDVISEYFFRGRGRQFIQQTIWEALDRGFGPDASESDDA